MVGINEDILLILADKIDSINLSFWYNFTVSTKPPVQITTEETTSKIPATAETSKPHSHAATNYHFKYTFSIITSLNTC